MKARMRCKVVSIREICNKAFYDKYECQKRLMREQSSKLNEIQLWHGTTHATVEHILCQNFDWRLCKKGLFGEGSYFAKEASYSHSYVDANDKYEMSMFLVDVLVGDYWQGYSSYKRPPEKEKHRLYDSCVDNMSNPTIYVIFERDQFYPRYLITYKRVL
ncbi:protein mono-ADP-ribosyltransferase PARP12-like [Hydractinia symbiolongicarpus]|uniref:protein mono-ADP-ribosyltransferase PARP12-like n=1 Tax=Hydractinia symbiolongicarpus TaxID=13093 RepID=UPI00254D8343|nr:protein mono-ADP-ribosyltransferase PARP12-like [Hydractinia symbiolongicarpus]